MPMRVVWAFVAGVVLAPVAAQAVELRIDAPEELSRAAEEVRRVDLPQLERDLAAMGLAMPPLLDVALVRQSDPLASRVPRWVVGFASGTRSIVIFPERVLPYPYDSTASVFRHEVTHLALTIRAGERPLPRWFHEGVAVVADSGWGIGGQVRLLFEMLREPGTAELTRLFASANAPDAAQAYGLAAALVADLQRRHGSAVVGGIAERVAGGMPFDRAFALETGETPDSAAARAWAAYRQWTNWVPSITSGSAMWLLILALAGAAWVAQRRRRARRRHLWDQEDLTMRLPPD